MPPGSGFSLTGRRRGGALRRRLARLTTREAFPRLTLVTFALVYVNVASGALVRVTDSGLGCPDWPLCNGRAVPAVQGHALIEYSNRLVAVAVVVAATLLAVSARRWYRRSHPDWFRLAAFVAGGMVAQIPLGAVTILTELHPIAVMTHFLLAIVLFGAATVLLVDVRGTPDPEADRPPWLRPAAALLVLWCLGLIVTGAVATTSGPHPGNADVPRLWNLLDAAYVHVRVAVTFVVALAGFLFLVARLGPPPRRVPRLAWLVVGLTALQIVVGEVQWRTELPPALVLLHVAVATALWAAVVALARSLVSRPAGLA